MAERGRRQFIKSIGMLGAAAAAPAGMARALAVPASGPGGARLAELEHLPRHPALGGAPVDDPYADVDWDAALHVASTTHVHVQTGPSTVPYGGDDQRRLDIIYNQMQLRHLPISNYRPSAPLYPIGSIRTNNFARQEFGVFRNGRYEEGPIDWNQVVMDPKSGWYRDLAPEAQRQLPMKLGPKLFEHVPDDLIVSPNAEHWDFTDAPQLHACAPGSLWSSGAPDHMKLGIQLQEHGYRAGTSLPWREAFRRMLGQMLFPDGGGVTINHPVWSGLTDDQIFQFLDFDPRVLGIEVFNHPSFPDPSLGWAVPTWDRILASGRRCLGFFVPDHGVNGRCMLLVPRFTEEECLRAYRKGAFYGSPAGSKLTISFKSIRLSGRKLSIVATGVPKDEWLIAYVTTDREKRWINGSPDKPFEFEIPLTDKGVPAISYVRVEVIRNLTMEHIFSQPIRFPRT